MRTNECLFIFVCVMHVNTLSIPQMGAYCVLVWTLVKFGKWEGEKMRRRFLKSTIDSEGGGRIFWRSKRKKVFLSCCCCYFLFSQLLVLVVSSVHVSVAVSNVRYKP